MRCFKPVWLCQPCWLLWLLLVLVARQPWILAAEDQDKAPAAVVEAPKDVADLRTIETRIQEVVAKVLPCTLGIRIGRGQGSGVIVSRDGYVITAGHVVGKPGQDVTLFCADGKTVQGKTLGVYKNADAGLIKISGGDPWPFAEMGRSAELKPGTWCLATGHPLGYQNDRPPVVRLGRVLRSTDIVIQTDCPLIAGDSGGPLFDLEGKVLGINSRIGGNTKMNFHVPVDVYQDHWDRLVAGESWEDPVPGRDSAKVKAAFREVVAEAHQCLVRVKCDGKDAALGTIIGPDGWVLTKASELKGKIVCRLGDQRELEARLVGVQQPNDLAMLKIDAFDLPNVRWNGGAPEVGQWVASPGLEDDPLTLGVVSVPRRKIPRARAFLGVVLNQKKEVAEIESILPQSPAQAAGLKAKDVITHVNEKPTPTRDELIATLKEHRRGQVVKLKVKRDNQDLEISAKLGDSRSLGARKQDMQNRMGGALSNRRDDFPLVLQHDSVLRPADCGGPLVDLSGQVVGINIARAGRTETYCVPGDVLLGVMYDLISGRLTPPEIIQQRKKEAEEERKKAEAEKKAEEERKKAEAEKKAEEERKKAEAEKKAEEERKKAEAEKKAEEERKKAEAEKKEEEEKKEPEPPENPEQGGENAESEKQPDEQKPQQQEAPAPEQNPPPEKP